MWQLIKKILKLLKFSYQMKKLILTLGAKFLNSKVFNEILLIFFEYS